MDAEAGLPQAGSVLLKRMLIACLGLASRALAQSEQPSPPVAAFPEDPPPSPTETPEAVSTAAPVQGFEPPPATPGPERTDQTDFPAPCAPEERDGFFFHFALGGGAMSVAGEGGGGGVTEALLVGGTPAWWLVLGGSLTGGVFDLEYRTGLFAMIGPFAQLYFERSESAYFRLVAGEAVVAESNRKAQRHLAVGFGVGGEGRLSRAWKIGPVLQLLLSGIDRSDGGHGTERTRTRTLIIPTLSLGITQH
jgi:hypothetical protein